MMKTTNCILCNEMKTKSPSSLTPAIAQIRQLRTCGIFGPLTHLHKYILLESYVSLYKKKLN